MTYFCCCFVLRITPFQTNETKTVLIFFNVALISSSSSVQGVKVVEVMEVVTVAQHGHLQEGAGCQTHPKRLQENRPKHVLGRHP